MSFGNTFENELMDHIFRNAAITLVGDAAGLLPSAAAGSLYLSLHTADPGEISDQTTAEVSYTGYARVALARGAGFAAASGGATALAATAAFGQRSNAGAAVEATHFQVGTASSGAGKVIARGIIGPTTGGFSKPFVGLPSTDEIKIVGHGLVVDDRVVFRSLLGSTLPTGLSEGVVYFVKTAPDGDTITLALTSGGATVDMTTLGSGIAQRALPMSIVQGTIPQLDTGTTFRVD